MTQREPTVRTGPKATTLWAVALAGLATAVITLVLAYTNPDPDRSVIRVVLALYVSLPYVIAGLIAWQRRPANPYGRLMIAAGFVFFGSILQWSTVPVVHTVGQLFDLVPVALFTHVFLAFPTGRLERRPERLLVIATYGVAIVLQVAFLMFGGSDPLNVLTVRAEPLVAETLQNVQLLGIAALALAGVVVLMIRRRVAGPSRRPQAALLIDAFGLGLVLIAALMVAGAFQLPVFEPLRIATFVVLGVAPFAFLGALLDARLARSGVGELLVALRADPARDLREPIARALRDPSLSLAYWMPRTGYWVDRQGHQVTLPGSEDRRAATVVDRGGQHVAALLHDPSLRDERELLDAVSAAAGLALENGRLQAELRARINQVRDSRSRVLGAERRERRRIERDLHDGAQQRLTVLALDLGVLAEQLRSVPDAHARVERAKHEVGASLRELRDLAHGIHPAVVTAHGLTVALESLTDRAPVPLRLTVDVDGRLDEQIELTAYYVVCESLANMAKHARATTALVRAVVEGRLLVVEVIDDGVGGADVSAGSGLRGIADRVDALNGRMTVASPEGEGTLLRIELPCG